MKVSMVKTKQSNLRRAARCFLWISLTAAAVTAADAQIFTFTSCSGVTATVSVSAVFPTTPTVSGGSTTYIYGVAGTFNLTVGGATTTSGNGTATIVFGNPTGLGQLTQITFQSPGTQTLSTVVSGWSVNLEGAGTLLTPGVFPTALPSLGSWTLPWLGAQASSDDYISLTPGVASYYLACSSGGGGGGGGGPTATSPSQALGDPSSLPGACRCPYPINIGTGNMFETAEDYSTGGPNPLTFRRYYNSLAAPTAFTARLGKNWRSNYDRYLNIAASSVIAERADGQQVRFTLNGGVWTPDTDIDLALTDGGFTWTLTDHEDNVETYATSTGLLLTIRARNGFVQTLQYDTNNQLIAVVDSFARQMMFAYSGGLLESVSTPDGLLLTYGFSGSGGSSVLTSVGFSTTPPTSVTYLYENAALPATLTGIVDENGARYLSWSYDSTGRVLTSSLGNGANITTIVYNDTDGSRTATNALGEQELFKFATLQSVPKVIEIDRLASATTTAATSTFSYDSNGYTARSVDWNGNITEYMHDVHGQPISVDEGAGSSQTRITTITYHPTFHLPLQIVTAGLTTNFSYDASGELLTKTLLDTTTSSSPYPTSGQTRTWTYTWSNFLETSVQSPRTDVTSLTKFTYDSIGALTLVTNSFNQTIQVTAHLPGGLPRTIVDPNGVITNLIWDPRHRLLSSTVNTAAGALITQFNYDAAGNLLSTTLPDGSSITNIYDAAHRLTGAADSLGDSIAYTLDALGDRTQIAVLDPSRTQQLQRSGVFDALGRLTQSIGGANQTTSYAYDSNGNVIGITDPLNHATQQSFDSLNRLSLITNPAGGNTAANYDAHNRITSVIDPNKVSTAYTFDGFGDLIQESSPASGTVTYHYDSAGNLSQKLDARGVVSNYSYDALNRLGSISYPGNGAENVAYAYDQSGHGFGVGRITSVTDAAGMLSRSYDERGNVVSETRTLASAALTTSYTYDGASRISSISYPSHWSVAYTRDAVGRITGATATAPGGSPQSLASAVAYEPFGPMKSLTHGNGITEQRSFDPDYRLTQLAAGGSAPVENLTYKYDAANNVLSIGDGITSGNNQTSTYDILNRLTSAAGAYGSLGYTYDANGNRLTESDTPAAADGLGSVTALTYNQSGRLSTVAAGTQPLTQYAYDAFGHRVEKIGSATGTTFYQYDASGRLLEETDGQGNPQVDYVYLNGLPIATIQPSNQKIYFLHDDRLGTPQIATDSTQAVTWSTTYQPFGQIATPPVVVVQDLRLPGQEAEVETGFYHNGFRDYVPAWGRYAESDPIGLAGGTNTYAYVGGNPLRYIDPLGLCNVSTTGDVAPHDNSLGGTLAIPAQEWTAPTTGRPGAAEPQIDYAPGPPPPGAALLQQLWNAYLNLVAP
jgi:RHS repeat-associated protein